MTDFTFRRPIVEVTEAQLAAIRDLKTVAAGREWFRQHGASLNSDEHMAFIVRMDALTKLETGDGGNLPPEQP
jgi:hypothetical protein